MNLRNAQQTATNRAKALRQSMSRSERFLWSKLRAGRTGFSFKRQYPVGPYVRDFYCPEALLCVELDGDCHGERIERDAERDRVLEELGVAT